MMKYRFKALGAKPNENDVVIEGYANYFAKDAYNERMDPMSVKLDRYKKNPILLFNHDMNYPVGRVIEVTPKEDGLYVKAAVSGVEHDRVSYIRELVKDGTLCTFSVRFADETVETDPETGGKLIKDWELQELSIVSIPAQPDSTFSLSKYKSLKDFRMDVLKAKGAMVAQYIQGHMDKLIEEMDVEKSELLESLMAKGGVTEPELNEVLAGNVTPVSESVLAACVEVLGCDAQELEVLNGKDVEAEKSYQEDKKDEKAEDPLQACVSAKIPKLIKEGYAQDQASAIAYDMCKEEKKSACENCEGGVKELVNESPTLMIMQSQLEMLGSLNAKMELLIKTVEALAGSQPAPKPEMEQKIDEMVSEYQKRLKALAE
jgi:HK97 family phage prohead protease